MHTQAIIAASHKASEELQIRTQFMKLEIALDSFITIIGNKEQSRLANLKLSEKPNG